MKWMKMVIETGGITYVFERSNYPYACGGCVMNGTDDCLANGYVWFYCSINLKCNYVCTEVINGRY